MRLVLDLKQADRRLGWAPKGELGLLLPKKTKESIPISYDVTPSPREDIRLSIT